MKNALLPHCRIAFAGIFFVILCLRLACYAQAADPFDQEIQARKQQKEREKKEAAEAWQQGHLAWKIAAMSKHIAFSEEVEWRLIVMPLFTEDEFGKIWDIGPSALQFRAKGAEIVPYFDGATVTYEPEPFLGPSYHSHQGKTDAAGMAQLDPELADYPLYIYVGLYRVRISKKVDGKETLPARYNSETELGREIAVGVRDSRENIVFRLTSK